jgi:hypothetical protein
MRHAFLQRPEFHINTFRAVLDFVDRRFLAFYSSCEKDVSWEIYCTRSTFPATDGAEALSTGNGSLPVDPMAGRQPMIF